jgi:hypothetical protein
MDIEANDRRLLDMQYAAICLGWMNKQQEL